MKYTAKRIGIGIRKDKYAVFTGSGYFRDSVYETKDEAEIRACEMSAHWYQEQIDKAFSKWEKLLDKKEGQSENGRHRQWGCAMA